MNQRVLIIAPIGNDAERIQELLHNRGLRTKVCLHCLECCEEIKIGAGAIVLTEEILEQPHFNGLLELLKNQPPWSELPLIILTSGGESRLLKLLNMTAQAAGSITLLERPLSSITLLRSIEVALRSRRRQFHVRDLLEKLNDMTAQLEKRVADRTSQLEAQAQHLRQLAAELTEIEESERKRLAQILHDHLQQLLVAAKLRLELFERKQSNGDISSIKEVLGFLDQAYDASRSLTAELRPPVLYESGLVSALHFLARKYKEQHGLTVHLLITDEIEPQSEVVKTFIYQSLRELLFNVIKYAGTKECFLRLVRLGREIHIQVRDEGVGFDSSHIDERRSVGGFGLFSIRERIQALGGQFLIKSIPGNGATFEIIITDHILPPTEPQIGKVESRPQEESKGLLKVLIADDHKIVRQSLAQVLVLQPFIEKVFEAQDGKDAIVKVEEHQPDVVIMDLNMPNLNGLEATRLLHSRYPHLKIIGLSVQAEEETAQAMKKAGAIEYFNKNMDTDLLVETLRNFSASSQNFIS